MYIPLRIRIFARWMLSLKEYHRFALAPARALSRGWSRGGRGRGAPALFQLGTPPSTGAFKPRSRQGARAGVESHLPRVRTPMKRTTFRERSATQEADSIAYSLRIVRLSFSDPVTLEKKGGNKGALSSLERFTALPLHSRFRIALIRKR